MKPPMIEALDCLTNYPYQYLTRDKYGEYAY